MQRTDFYGPGALAKKFLKEIGFAAEHPLLDIPAEAEALLRAQSAAHWRDRRPWVYRFPFSAAYFGGRIESAAVGRWERSWDFDLHSAYPAALAMLPRWRREDLRYVAGPGAQGVADSIPVGMYLVEWECPQGWHWYPLP